MRHKIFVLLISICCVAHSALAAPAHEPPGEHHGEHGEHEDHHTDRTHIAPDTARQAGIATAVAGPGIIAESLTAYGRITAPPENISHVRGRFPGLITQVEAGIGDSVQAGDLLANIESNDSLNVYPVHSPIAGVVTERHANTGESTLDRVLFTVMNLNTLWAELKIFPTQRSQVSPGDAVHVIADNLRQEATIKHLVPAGGGHPFVTARVEIDNSNGLWSPGLMVAGDIQTTVSQVDLVVQNAALQTLEGNTVVFVVEDNEYVAHPVETGRRDHENTEIVAGLSAGARYVVNNSYLIKADIEKSGAAHHH